MTSDDPEIDLHLVPADGDTAVDTVAERSNRQAVTEGQRTREIDNDAGTHACGDDPNDMVGGSISSILDAAETVAPSAAGVSQFPPLEQRPCYRVYDDWVVHPDGRKARAGTYWHSVSERTKEGSPVPVDLWLCGPLHLEAMTNDGEGTRFGVLLRFMDRAGQWREWPMPYELLAGSGEELRRELLDMGLALGGPRERALLADYLQHRTPERRVLCTSRTGWARRNAFVLPAAVIGPGADTVVFQKGARSGKDQAKAGTLEGWRQGVARLAVGNPMMMFALSSAFVGPLLQLTDTEGGGVHLVGSSSSGKTTLLDAARSVWGGPEFKRSWRATANGVEGVAELHNDLLLPMDEINEVDAREAGRIAYMLTNGVGKSRATRTGAARPPKRWRTFVLSTGERSLEATMLEGGMSAKAGQSIRLLDIPSVRPFGCFDELHEQKSGRALSDAIKRAADANHGIVGLEYLERLTADRRDLRELLQLAKAIPELAGHGGQEGRAAARFALIAMAGELATEYGLTGWREGAAVDAATEAFKVWLSWRGTGDDERRKIPKAVRDFLDRHGGSRFIDADATADVRESMERLTRDRAGYRRRAGVSDGRLYYFNAAALREATTGFDLSAVIAALTACGALERAKAGTAQQQAKFGGVNGKYYVINPEKLEV